MASTSRSRIMAVMMAALVLIGGANLAVYAANGKPLLLGKTNVETKKSTVKNTGKGPALALKTKPGQPPLKVNRNTKVKRLNADLIDGADAEDLESVGFRYEVPSSAASGVQVVAFPGLPAGIYQLNYSIITQGGGTTVYCHTVPSRQALSYSSEFGSTYDTNVGSAIIDTTDAALSLTCSGSSSMQLYSTPGDAISEVNFVRLDRVIEATPTTSRQSAKRGAATSTGGATGR